MSSPVSIVGVGARTPVGLTAHSAAAAVRAGITRLGEHPYMVDKAGEPYRVAMDPTMEEPVRIERVFALATSALDEALGMASLPEGFELPVYLALPELGRWFSNQDARQLGERVAAHLAPRKISASVIVVPEGNAAGLLALQRGVALLQQRQRPVVAVVGADSHLDPDFLDELDEDARLASTTNRWGYPPGEGAGALLLSLPPTARAHRLPDLGQVRAVETAREVALLGGEAPCIGVGLAAALTPALRALGTETVSAVYCDINGERYRNGEWVYASLRAPTGVISDPTAFVAPADCWGDVGAATGPLLIGLAIASAQRRYSRGPHTLVWCSSESGLRGAAVISVRTP